MVSFHSCKPGPETRILPRAVRGVLNLEGWDFDHDGPVDLAGEFEFYWKKLLGPRDFEPGRLRPAPGFIEVPGYWNEFQADGKKISADGFATYHVKVLMDAGDKSLALKVLDMSTAFRLFVNGQNIYSAGVVGKNAATSIPQFDPRVVDFKTNANILDIIFQISNFHHRKGGAWEQLTLGTENRIRQIRETNIGYELFLFGSILIMAIYHFGLFALRRQERSTLFFGIFCLLIALRILTTGERYFLRLFPDISWPIFVKLEYLSYYLAVPAFVLFFYSLFSQKYFKTVCASAIGVFAIFCTLVIIWPLRLFSHTLTPYHIITLILFSYGMYILINYSLKGEYSAAIFLAGFSILLLTAINDMLLHENIIKTANLIPLGLFIFIFSQAFLISLRFSRAFGTVDYQRRKLKKTNEIIRKEIRKSLKAKRALRKYQDELEKRVQERTADILEANTALSLEIEERKQAQQATKTAQEVAEIANRAKSEFLANMSHELRTPLNHVIGFTELLLDAHFGELNELQEEYLGDVHHSSKHLLSLINDILDLSKVESGKLELNPTEFDLKTLIENSLVMIEEKVRKNSINVSVEIDELPDSIRADERSIKQIMYNLLSNAVKFTPAGGSISVTAHRVFNPASGVQISVADTGIGMEPGDLKRIFKPFEQVETSTSRKYQGTGLGLSLSKNLVELHNGEIWAQSGGKEKGSMIHFVIPG